MKTKSTPSEALGKNIQKSEETLAVLNDAITKLRKNEYPIRANAVDENRDALYRALVLRLESDTDQTFSGSRTISFTVVDRPAQPQLPPSPPLSHTLQLSGHWSFDGPAMIWIWDRDPIIPVPQCRLEK